MMATRLFVLLAAAMIAGCGSETLYSDLSEREANEMLAVLLSEGIDARKVGYGDTLEVQTSRRDLPAAIRLLSEHGYPREKFQSLGDVFQREGFVSSPTEERARLLYALSQELARTISNIDGVVTARVHLAIPERRALSETTGPSSASIFIKYRPGAAVADQAASIKALVVNSIEGLPYENVTVSFFPASRPHRSVNRRERDGVHLAGLPLNARTAAFGLLFLVVTALIAVVRKPRSQDSK